MNGNLNLTLASTLPSSSSSRERNIEEKDFEISYEFWKYLFEWVILGVKILFIGVLVFGKMT